MIFDRFDLRRKSYGKKNCKRLFYREKLFYLLFFCFRLNPSDKTPSATSATAKAIPPSFGVTIRVKINAAITIQAERNIMLASLPLIFPPSYRKSGIFKKIIRRLNYP